MFIDIDQKGILMKRVYQLAEQLKSDPNRITVAQALTRDASRPLLGLKGTHGLYGSPEWWLSIHQRKMPLLTIAGTIRRVYVAGQDGGNENNGIELLLEDGSVRDEGIYVNRNTDISLFRIGCWVELVCVLDEMKKQPARDGGINYAEIPLEMAVSLHPIASIPE